MAEISIREVAAHAGVSMSTVSNALNRPERVSPRSAARVATAIAELGYVPNTAARQLRAGRSQAIGMAVMNITNPFFAEVALGAEETAHERGYAVILGNSYDSVERERRYLELFERQRLDGVLIAPVRGHDAIRRQFEKRGIPVVLIDRADPQDLCSSVSLDDVLGGRMACEHLVASGCREIAFLGGPFVVPQMRDRLAGCRAAAADAGVGFRLIETDTLNPGLGRHLGAQIADLPVADRPDGIFAANDVLALGVMQSLISHGVRVPEDVGVVGYDDIDFAAASIVPLTSVRQPSYSMGVAAATLLLDGLQNGDNHRSIRFDPELMVRQSTKAVPPPPSVVTGRARKTIRTRASATTAAGTPTSEEAHALRR